MATLFNRDAQPDDSRSLAEWLNTWLTDTYVGQDRFPRREVQLRAFSALPPHLIPTWQEALWAWWMRRFHDATRQIGLVFTDGPGGVLLDRQLALPFEELQDNWLTRLKQARGDVGCIEREVSAVAIVRPDLNLHVPSYLRHLRKAAGF